MKYKMFSQEMFLQGNAMYSPNCFLFSWAHNGMWAEVTWAAFSPLCKPCDFSLSLSIVALKGRQGPEGC